MKNVIILVGDCYWWGKIQSITDQNRNLVVQLELPSGRWRELVPHESVSWHEKTIAEILSLGHHSECNINFCD